VHPFLSHSPRHVSSTSEALPQTSFCTEISWIKSKDASQSYVVSNAEARARANTCARHTNNKTVFMMRLLEDVEAAFDANAHLDGQFGFCYLGLGLFRF